MKKEETKQFILWCVLGAIGCGFMAAGDWLLGCIPLQQTDTGLFNRAYYLSGSYGLWKPVLTVGLGAIGGFFYYFVVKALNADIDEKHIVVNKGFVSGKLNDVVQNVDLSHYIL